MMSDSPLFDLYERLDESAIDQWIKESEPESGTLEYKSLTGKPFGHTDDRENLAELISAFANSDGGIILWGIRDQKHIPVDKQRFDTTTALQKLQEQTPRSTNPPVTGVKHRIIGDVIASWIPPSDTGPHMAVAGKHHTYFHRSGDSTRKIEHSHLDSLFGRRPNPILVPELYVRERGNQANDYRTSRLILHVSNIGKGLAKHFMVRIGKCSGVSVRDDAWQTCELEYRLKLVPTHIHRAHFFDMQSGESEVVHAGTDRPVVPLRLNPKAGDPPPRDSILMHVILGCEGMKATEYVFDIKLSALTQGDTFPAIKCEH